ncbi:MAG: 2-dehydro-3-deoxy-D-gluconate 5-dehydrogenase KduD [Beijerinckiaceae bacterium]
MAATHPFSLEGRVALVTGGATGIGMACAVALAEAGADVAITVNRSPGTEALAAIRATGRRALELPADLSAMDAAAMSALVAKVEFELGPLAILVNNAGIIRRADAVDYSEDDWSAVISTNLDAVWRLTQAAGKVMTARGHGRIVTIASLLSFQGGIRVPAYAASKHAVAGLTKALANEWAAKGVSVNAIAPGYIVTANTDALRADPKRSADILSRIPAGRWGDAKDIAGAAVFLASDAAVYVNGHIMTVDGGWMAR